MNWNQPDKRIVVGLLLLMLEKTECLKQEHISNSIRFFRYLEFRCLNNCKWKK